MRIFFNFLFLFVLTHASDQEEKKIEEENDFSILNEKEVTDSDDNGEKKGIDKTKPIKKDKKIFEKKQNFIQTDIHEKMRKTLKDGVDDPKRFDDEFTPYNYNDEKY
jgi:hypothetical protein